MTPNNCPFRFTSLAVLSLLLFLSIPPLPAQNSGRGFVKAQAGATLGTVNRNLASAGGFGVRLNSFADLFAEVGKINDVMTPAMQSQLNNQHDLLAEQAGIPLQLSSKFPSQYTLLGTRITIPLKSALNPFFEIGGSISRTSFSNVLALVHGVDVGPVFRPGSAKDTYADFMFSASAGVHIAVTRRFGIDVAYRYFRISTTPPAPIAAMIYSGIVFRF